MELTTRECKSLKCKAEVADVLIVGQTGAHRALAVDPGPATWEDGGRVRLKAHQPTTAKHPLAARITHAGQAFGVRRLYRPHSESCAGGTGRGSTRKKAGHD